MVAILGSIHLRIGSNEISQPDQTSFGSSLSSLCFWNESNPLRNVEAVAMYRNQSVHIRTCQYYILADIGSHKSIASSPRNIEFLFSLQPLRSWHTNPNGCAGSEKSVGWSLLGAKVIGPL